jgi:hypothetical protein
MVIITTIESMAFIWVSKVALVFAFDDLMIFGLFIFLHIFGFVRDLFVLTDICRGGQYARMRGLVEDHIVSALEETNSEESFSSLDLIVEITAIEAFAVIRIAEKSLFRTRDQLIEVGFRRYGFITLVTLFVE